MSNKEHTLYALSNPSMPGVIKIGITDNLQARLVSLYNTSTPFKFEVVSKIVYSSRAKATKAESYLHSYLWMLRANDSREFFYLTNDAVINIFDKVKQNELLPDVDLPHGTPKIAHTVKELELEAKVLRESIKVLRVSKSSWSDMYKYTLRKFKERQEQEDTINRRIQTEQEILINYSNMEFSERQTIQALENKIKSLRKEKRLVTNERESRIKKEEHNYYENKYKQQLKDTCEELKVVVKDISILHPIKKYRASRIIKNFYKKEENKLWIEKNYKKY